jgi:hypothetical protein
MAVWLRPPAETLDICQRRTIENLLQATKCCGNLVRAYEVTMKIENVCYRKVWRLNHITKEMLQTRTCAGYVPAKERSSTAMHSCSFDYIAWSSHQCVSAYDQSERQQQYYSTYYTIHAFTFIRETPYASNTSWQATLRSQSRTLKVEAWHDMRLWKGEPCAFHAVSNLPWFELFPDSS